MNLTDRDFFWKYQLLVKICQAPQITVAKNAETWVIFLYKKNPKVSTDLICSEYMEFFQLKIILLTKAFCFLFFFF